MAGIVVTLGIVEYRSWNHIERINLCSGAVASNHGHYVSQIVRTVSFYLFDINESVVWAICLEYPALAVGIHLCERDLWSECSIVECNFTTIFAILHDVCLDRDGIIESVFCSGFPRQYCWYDFQFCRMLWITASFSVHLGCYVVDGVAVEAIERLVVCPIYCCCIVALVEALVNRHLGEVILVVVFCLEQDVGLLVDIDWLFYLWILALVNPIVGV